VESTRIEPIGRRTLLPLTILFGSLVGIALGLTGGGGSLIAVPLLVYGLAVAPREAFGISLAAVAATAAVGLVPRFKAGLIETRTGMLFALSGICGAPVGISVAQRIPESLLLALFGALMLAIALRMWTATNPHIHAPLTTGAAIARQGPTCQRTPDGNLTMTSRCALLLLILGLITGFLSGMFGVGGGFVIVPALVLFSGMTIHRAVATSLLVIVLVGISGVTSHFIAGRGIPLGITALFLAGGIVGMAMAGVVANRLPPPMLQRVFAVGIVAVAFVIMSKSFVY
jgi:uncharacterized protein